MELPSPRYILTRTIFLLAALFAILSGFNFVKKNNAKLPSSQNSNRSRVTARFSNSSTPKTRKKHWFEASR